MRIVHIVNKLSNWGNGIVNLAIDLAIEQKRAGHDVAFIAGLGGSEELLDSFGVTIYPLRAELKITTLPFATVQALASLRSFKPDIVHAHTQKGLFLVLPWTKLYRIPLVTHLHNVHDRNLKRMALGDRLITVSSAVADTMRELGVPARKLKVVLNGNLQSPRVPALADLTPKSLAHPAIVTVAGIYPRKGISELMEAFDQVAQTFPDAHLYLVGEGQRKEFGEKAGKLRSGSHIHFEGFQPQSQAYMLACDIFVLASRRDSCPLVLAEAREAGCAIIASDVDGIPEALDHGEAGILVPPQSPKDLAAAILLLLQDAELRQEWQAKAKAHLERFAISRMASEVQYLYLELKASSVKPRKC
jgi:glycosyltransferase involved in cell wall biosynthesis